MNIKCSEFDNMSNTLDYFNSIKQLSDELIKYIKSYRQLILEYMKKIQSMQTNFKKKLTKSENPKTSQIITELTSKIFNLLQQNNELFQLSLDEIDLRLKEFDTFTKEKSESIKTIQKLSSDLNKELINSYTEVNKNKNTYLNSLSKTEEIINKFYSNKNKILQHENGLEQKLPENEYTLIKEQIKNEQNEMVNAMKNSKKLEISYQDSINLSLKIHNKYIKNHKAFTEKIKKYTCELSNEIKILIVSFMLSYKNNYKQPLSTIDVHINEFNVLEEGKEMEKIISNDYKSDNLLKIIIPNNYRLKTISLLKESNYIKSDDDLNLNKDKEKDKNNNILQKKKSISILEDGFEEMEYISDESVIQTIKSLFNNFNLIDKEDFNIQFEESKNKTQQFILKIISNMNSYPFGKLGKNSKKYNEQNNVNSEYKRRELSAEEFLELKELLDNHENRIIFLQKLSDYRARGKFYIDLTDYILLCKFLNIICEKVKRDIDYHSAEMSIILSQTYFIEENNRKKYLQEGIKDNKLFKDKTFWEEFLVYSINKEIMKTMKRDSKTKENRKNSDTKLSNVVFSQVLTLIDNMFEFDVKSNVIKEVLEPKIKYYKLNEGLKNTINDVIKSKQEEKESLVNEKIKKEIKKEEVKIENENKEKEVDEKKKDEEIVEVSENNEENVKKEEDKKAKKEDEKKEDEKEKGKDINIEKMKNFETEVLDEKNEMDKENS